MGRLDMVSFEHQWLLSEDKDTECYLECYLMQHCTPEVGPRGWERQQKNCKQQGCERNQWAEEEACGRWVEGLHSGLDYMSQ